MAVKQIKETVRVTIFSQYLNTLLFAADTFIICGHESWLRWSVNCFVTISLSLGQLSLN